MINDFSHFSPGAGSINLSNYLSIDEKIDGFTHTHYNTLIPMFTADDILAIYKLYNAGHVNSFSTFTAEVVTSQGVWIFKIKDVSLFNEFCSTQLNTQEKITQFDDSLSGWDLFGKNSERGFLTLINNSGLQLFKKDGSEYKLRTIDSQNVVINTICN